MFPNFGGLGKGFSKIWRQQLHSIRVTIAKTSPQFAMAVPCSGTIPARFLVLLSPTEARVDERNHTLQYAPG